MLFIIVLIVLLAYLYGGFSTARVITKSVRSLNIYKVGSGFADTENIYSNVSKPLGVLVGAVDITKSYAFLYFVHLLLTVLDKMNIPPDLSVLYNDNIMMLYGVALLVGHCLPLTNKLRGGRGIFTYIGILLFINPYPMLITLVLAMLLILVFHQIRFAQYCIVLFPVILTQLMSSLHKYLPVMPVQNTISSFTSKLLGLAVLMGILNFIVSKRLKEF